MRIEKRDGSIERRILIGMVVSRPVLAKISASWDGKLFSSAWCNLVGKWCVKFFRKYDKPPKKSIAGIFDAWASDNKDEATIEMVEKFLQSISGEYSALSKEINVDHLLDTANEHFNKVRLKRLSEEIQGDVDEGDHGRGLERVRKFGHIEICGGAGINVLQDKETIMRAFSEQDESLIKYPGALGEFLGNSLSADAFVGFMGPEKRGKTWILTDIAWMGVAARHNVAFFEVGDMSQNQIMRRFMIRAANRPLGPKTVYYPKSIDHTENDLHAHVEHKKKVYKGHLSWQEAWKGCKRILDISKTNRPLMKLSVHPNSTMSVAGIRSILETWNHTEGWLPKIIVVDYADILAPMTGGKESRDQINETWKGLRALSQEYHCLVVTATQADAASYEVETIGRKNFSEDKRKFAHVTAMFGINATSEEKEQGVMRFNPLVVRESAFSDKKCVHIAGCLDLARPIVKSCF